MLTLVQCNHLAAPHEITALFEIFKRSTAAFTPELVSFVSSARHESEQLSRFVYAMTKNGEAMLTMGDWKEVADTYKKVSAKVKVKTPMRGKAVFEHNHRIAAEFRQELLRLGKASQRANIANVFKDASLDYNRATTKAIKDYLKTATNKDKLKGLLYHTRKVIEVRIAAKEMSVVRDAIVSQRGPLQELTQSTRQVQRAIARIDSKYIAMANDHVNTLKPWTELRKLCGKG